MVLVLRVGAVSIGWAAQMLSAVTFRPHDRAHFFTGIFGIEVIEQIAERCEIIVTLGTVHTVMNGDETNIIAWKNQFRVLSYLQIVSTEAAHILDDEGFNQSLFHKGKCFLDAGTIEVRPGITIIHENPDVDEPVFLCVFR